MTGPSATSPVVGGPVAVPAGASPRRKASRGVKVRVMTDKNVVSNLAQDLAGLVDAPRFRPGPPCGVATTLRRIRDTDPVAVDALDAAIDNETISSAAIAEMLTRHGHVLSSQSVARHRRRGRHNGCRCPR